MMTPELTTTPSTTCSQYSIFENFHWKLPEQVCLQFFNFSARIHPITSHFGQTIIFACFPWHFLHSFMWTFNSCFRDGGFSSICVLKWTTAGHHMCSTEEISSCVVSTTAGCISLLALPVTTTLPHKLISLLKMARHPQGMINHATFHWKYPIPAKGKSYIFSWSFF